MYFRKQLFSYLIEPYAGKSLSEAMEFLTTAYQGSDVVQKIGSVYGCKDGDYFWAQ